MAYGEMVGRRLGGASGGARPSARRRRVHYEVARRQRGCSGRAGRIVGGRKHGRTARCRDGRPAHSTAVAGGRQRVGEYGPK